MSLSKRSAIVRGAGRHEQEMLVMHLAAPGAHGVGVIDTHVATAAAMIGDAERQALDIIEAARREATAVVQQAETERSRVFAESRAEGLRTGLTEGTEAVAQETSQLLATIRAAAQSGQQLRDALVAGAERQVVELALEVARKILGHRARMEPELVLEMARKAMARTNYEEIVRIRVNPDQLALTGAMFAKLPDGADLLAEGDAGIDLGGCVVDTRAGMIDARLDTQVDQVGNVLLALTAALDD